MDKPADLKQTEGTRWPLLQQERALAAQKTAGKHSEVRKARNCSKAAGVVTFECT